MTDGGNLEGASVSKQQEAEAFLKAHSERVFNLAYRLAGNPTDAEDLAQDALIRALKALPGFRGESAESTWLYRVVVNAWKNRVRAEKRRKFWKMLPLDKFFRGGDEDGGEAFAADDPPIDAGLEADETGKAVQEALSGLEDESRAVVVLREIEGLSYGRIAEVLGIPEGTVKSRLSRSRADLRERLRDFIRGGE
jgi:RNA polymerase sigma-70 factor (ECF subfamily)